MKFTTYLRDGAPRLAAVDGTDLIDLNDADPQTPCDLRAALRAGVDLAAAGGGAIAGKATRVPLSSVKLAPLATAPSPARPRARRFPA